MSESYHMAVVGGGPAGASCILALKNSGLKIAWIDKAAFPRDKICGDAIGGRVKKVLMEISPSLLTDLERSGNKNISAGWKLFSPGGKEIEVKFSNPGYVSKRLDFDSWLYGKAKENQEADLIQAEVNGIRTTEEGVELTLSGGRKLSCSLVIGCDGAHSVVAKQLAGFKVDNRHYSGAVRAYYRNVLGTAGSDMLEIHLVKGFLPGYFWIFPLTENVCNVGFGMLSSDIKQRRIDLKLALKQIIQTSPGLTQRFEKAELVDDVKGFGLPLGGKRRPISGSRFMLCGDAASLIDPLTGEGIGNAMLSAVMAARQAVRCFSDNNFTESKMKKYDETVYKKLLPELSKNLMMQRTFNRPWLINFLVNVALVSPRLKNWFAKKL